MKIALVAVVTIAICLARLILPSEGITLLGAYKDTAHLWVGFLIGCLVVSRDRQFWLPVLALCATELGAVFLKGK